MRLVRSGRLRQRLHARGEARNFARRGVLVDHARVARRASRQAPPFAKLRRRHSRRPRRSLPRPCARRCAAGCDGRGSPRCGELSFERPSWPNSYWPFFLFLKACGGRRHRPPEKKQPRKRGHGRGYIGQTRAFRQRIRCSLPVPPSVCSMRRPKRRRRPLPWAISRPNSRRAVDFGRFHIVKARLAPLKFDRQREKRDSRRSGAACVESATAPSSSRLFVVVYVGDACARRRAADTYLSMTYGSDSMTARFFALSARPAALLLMGLMFAASPVSPASAQQSCQEDFQRLTQRRMAQIGVLN